MSFYICYLLLLIMISDCFEFIRKAFCHNCYVTVLFSKGLCAFELFFSMLVLCYCVIFKGLYTFELFFYACFMLMWCFQRWVASV